VWDVSKSDATPPCVGRYRKLMPEGEPVPRVSVIICTRNRPDKIGNAVESVLNNCYGDFDLTVIDQSTSGETREALLPRMSDARLRYVALVGKGLSRAYNKGISDTCGEILAFTDDDCIVPTDWIASIAAAFEAEPDGDLLYGQVLPASAESAGEGLTPLLEIKSPERLDRRHGFRVFGMGANFAARRRLFDAVGDFDEILGGGGPLRSSQDFDFAYRTYRSGSVILLRPEVTLLHDGHRDEGDWPTLLHNYGMGDGAFYSKHVRCGDIRALILLMRCIGTWGSRVAVKRALGYDSPNRYYLHGVIAGVRAGRRFEIDRTTRRYRALAS
jgi:glycosyltransferase involved in cell wall biosynthesis